MIPASDIFKSFWDEEKRLGKQGRLEHLELLCRLIMNPGPKRLSLSSKMSSLLKTYGGKVAIFPCFLQQVNLDAVINFARIAREVFKLECRILRPVKIKSYELLYDKQPWSYVDGNAMINDLAGGPEYARYGRVFVLTDAHIWADPHGWVYGYAGMRIPVGVVNTVYLKDPTLFHRVAVHELGHAYSLPHCEDSSCLMQGVPSEGIKSLPYDFCDRCIGVILSSTKKSFGSDSNFSSPATP